eukprot:27472_1
MAEEKQEQHVSTGKLDQRKAFTLLIEYKKNKEEHFGGSIMEMENDDRIYLEINDEDKEFVCNIYTNEITGIDKTGNAVTIKTSDKTYCFKYDTHDPAKTLYNLYKKK